MRPRIRSIKPEMWADEKIVALSRDARLLLLGLVTMADDEGRFRARRSTIWGHAFPDDDEALRRIDKWIGEIKEQGMVVFYLVDGTPYGAFRNWRKHQVINKPKPSDLPPPPDPKVSRANKVKTTVGVRDGSGNGNGSLPHSSGSSTSPTGRRPFRSDPIPDPVPVLSSPTAESRTLTLCYRLAWHIHSNEAKAEPPYDSQRWTDDMRLLVKDRGGDEPAFLEVETVIDWCQRDGFWRSNILSPGKLRKQFTQLLLKAAPAPGANVVPMRSGRDPALVKRDRFMTSAEYQEDAS